MKDEPGGMIWLWIGLWTVWCGLHSLLITTGVRQWFEGRGGAWMGYYRLGYVLFSLVSLAALLWFGQTLPQGELLLLPLWAQGIQAVLFVSALALFIGGARVYDLRVLLGLTEWQAYRAGRNAPPPAFSADGILRRVRHPWYGGGIALLWSLPNLTDLALATRAILTVYLILGALLEERKLIAAFGQPYRDYCRHTPMLFPRLFRLRGKT